MNKQRKALSTPKPTFTPLQTRLLQPTCTCGGSAGIDGLCSECRGRKFTSSDDASASLDFSQYYPSLEQQESHSVEQAIIPGSRVSVRPSFGHDFSRVHVHAPVPETIQTKLTVNQPGDPYEQEADQVADQVMRMSETEFVQRDGYFGDPQGLRVQRMSPQEDEVRRQPEEEKEEIGGEPIEEEAEEESGSESMEEETLQAKESPGHTPTVTPELDAHIHSFRGGGQPLPEATRAFMEPRFGFDFSQVRIHTDERAAETARKVNALAYTVGRDVMFGEGKYQPGTSEGQRLIAHELTHVVQQGAGHTAPSLVQRDDAGGDAFEQFKITAADLKKPEITNKLNALSRTGLLDYKGKVADPKVKAYINKLLAISTPLSEIREDVQIKSSGSAQFKVNDVNVTIKPDTKDKKMKKGRAKTRFQLLAPVIAAKKNGKVVSIKSVNMIIQTTYGPGVTGESKSRYGRGTIPGEKDTTLRYHEGGHALDFIRYLKNNALPKFTGRVGMTVKEFRQARKEYEPALEKYRQMMRDYSIANTDCVGITIDDFKHVHGVQCK
jgi:hypothetical protein